MLTSDGIKTSFVFLDIQRIIQTLLNSESLQVFSQVLCRFEVEELSYRYYGQHERRGEAYLNLYKLKLLTVITNL